MRIRTSKPHVWSDGTINYDDPQSARQRRRKAEKAERQKLKGNKVKPDQPQPRGFSK